MMNITTYNQVLCHTKLIESTEKEPGHWHAMYWKTVSQASHLNFLKHNIKDLLIFKPIKLIDNVLQWVCHDEFGNKEMP